ncbi:MAG: nucleotidyltransferase domain-containing protein [Candidatus Thorarchaeota archaeon]
MVDPVEKKMFSLENRSDILNTISDKLSEDSRISGVILVGSGAYNFKDKYSDIDLAIVSKESENLAEVFNDWKAIMNNTFSVIHSFETKFAPNSLLHGFYLDNFLEINMGFQPESNIYAKRKDWKIIFDKTGKLEQITQTSWQEAQKRNPLNQFTSMVDGSWHLINQALVAIARENYWQALYEIESIREYTILIASIDTDLRLKRFQDAEKLPEDLLKDLECSLISALTKEALFNAIKKITMIYYREVKKTTKKLDGPDYSFLEKKMLELIGYFEKELFE